MKKKISYAILFSLFLVSCFAYDEIQWKTTKDLYNVPVLSSGGHWSQEDIRQDTLLKTSNKSGVFYNGYDAGFRDDFYVSAEFENAEVCLPLDSVVNVTCKMQLPEALISGKTKPKYVDEITLQSFFSNRKQLIKQTYPNGVTNAEDEYFPWETLLEINGGDLYLSNVYVKLSNSFNFGFSKFFIKDMEMIDEKTYKFECICEDFYHPDSKYKIEKEAIAMLYAEIDGDYIKVFLFDTENLFKIYARINKETEHELNSYFETGLCNLSKVTWPRHADGTCDYDNANDNETASTSGNPDTSAEAAVSKPAPAVGKTATVTENLRLRTDDKATAEVVTTLAAGTRVKVEAIGKEETGEYQRPYSYEHLILKDIQIEKLKNKNLEFYAGNVGYWYSVVIMDLDNYDYRKFYKSDNKKRYLFYLLKIGDYNFSTKDASVYDVYLAFGSSIRNMKYAAILE